MHSTASRFSWVPGGVRPVSLSLIWLGWISLGCSTEFSLSKSASDSCRRCTRPSCELALTECLNDESCREIEECTSQCRGGGGSPTACDQRCLPAAKGLLLINALSMCQAEHCSAACGRSCGGFVYQREGCAGCVEKNCCEQSAACASAPGCRAMDACLSDCMAGDWVCYNTCRQIPGGATDLALGESLAVCMAGRCAHECGIGEHWGCVGETRYLSPDEPSLTIGTKLVDLKFQPIQGVSARACYWTDDDCPAPLAMGETDAAGNLTLSIKQRTQIPFRVELNHAQYVDAVMIFPLPINGTPFVRYVFLLPKREELATLAAMMGVTSNGQEYGHAELYLLDCVLQPAPHLVLRTASPDARAFYVQNNLPDGQASETDKTGLSLLVNLPGSLAPGNLVKVQAFFSSDQSNPILEGQLLVKPGKLSLGVLWPN